MLFSKKNASTKKSAAMYSAIECCLPIVEFDVYGKVAHVNKAFTDMTGFGESDVLGKTYGFFTGDAEVKWSDIVQGAACTVDEKQSKQDGSFIWVQANYSCVFDKTGKPMAIVRTAIDIHARKMNGLDAAGKISAIDRSQAMIEFALDGTIVSANKNFLDIFGYPIEEIRGRHHSMFVNSYDRAGHEYLAHWANLGRGQVMSGEYERVTKDGKKVWIFGSYNPIFGEDGKPCKIVKFASEITEQKRLRADTDGQIAAIGKSQAVIAFAMDGSILSANENFLKTMGYTMAEISGRHHSMFVDPRTRASSEYIEFWASLNRGQHHTAEYKRIGSGGREVWIQGSYNPILDTGGVPFKVVKYATDITPQVRVRMANERVRGMMETVAAGAEELNASVREISEAMVKSRQAAVAAVDQVEMADTQAQSLNNAALSMKGIVELISNITGQINLLALNATIESARAGEAGRGFAVVASEVKNLASQAKQATDRIGQEIGNLNGISSEVVLALNCIKQSIQNVSEYVTTTAAAVEEQSTVTNEMSSSMQRAASEAAAIAA